MEELMSKGMRYANQALLSGCSAGGLASILHCDEFGGLFSRYTKVKCLSDAGLFLDAVDVSGGRTLRKLFGGVVNLQGVHKNLPGYCTNHLDPTSRFGGRGCGRNDSGQDKPFSWNGGGNANSEEWKGNDGAVTWNQGGGEKGQWKSWNSSPNASKGVTASSNQASDWNSQGSGWNKSAWCN